MSLAELLHCRVLLTEPAEFGEGCGGLAGVNGFGALGNALLEIDGEAGGYQGGGGVEQHNVAAGAGDAGENVIEKSGVGGDVAADKLIEGHAGQAGHLGSDAGGFQGGLTGFGLLDAGDDGLAGGGELIDSIGSVDDEGALCAEGGERAADEQDTAGSQDADDLGAGSGGVGERAAEVEDGAEAERAAQGAEGFHGGVIEGREEEHEAGVAKALDGQLRREGDGNAEGLEDVRGAAAGGDGAVAVLGDLGAGCGGYQGRAGGDVEGERSAAAGADNVDELIALVGFEGKRQGALAHDLNEAGQLGGQFAAGGEDGEQGGDLDIRNFAGEDFSEGVGRLFTGKSGAVLGEGFEEFLQRGHIS